jgi:hypothetical protein
MAVVCLEFGSNLLCKTHGVSEPTEDQPTMAEILRRIREQYAADERAEEHGPAARTLH